MFHLRLLILLNTMLYADKELPWLVMDQILHSLILFLICFFSRFPSFNVYSNVFFFVYLVFTDGNFQHKRILRVVFDYAAKPDLSKAC